jgi:hypothetical protein
MKSLSLTQLSQKTVRRLLSAPNKSFTAASRYRSVVDGHLGKKDNSGKKFHADAHYCAAQVIIIRFRIDDA